jgi:hypothetical protein
MIFHEKRLKYHFPHNGLKGIQWPAVAEAVLKNNARIVFEAVSESHNDGHRKDADPIFKNDARIVSGLSQNLAQTAWQNDAALLFLKTKHALFSGPFQHFTSTTRQMLRCRTPRGG